MLYTLQKYEYTLLYYWYNINEEFLKYIFFHIFLIYLSVIENCVYPTEIRIHIIVYEKSF